MAQWERGGRSGRRRCIKRGEPEEGTLLIKCWRWEEGDKGLFFLPGNGELSEQEGERQKESKQGVSNLNPIT